MDIEERLYMKTTAGLFGFTLTSLRRRHSPLAAAEPFGTSLSEDGVGTTGWGAFSHSAAQTGMRTGLEKIMLLVHTSHQS